MKWIKDVTQDISKSYKNYCGKFFQLYIKNALNLIDMLN